MKTFARRIAFRSLERVLSRPCENRVPRSGSRGEAVNCFFTAIDKGDEPYLIVQSLKDGTLGCREWDGASYSIEVDLALETFHLKDFRVTHFYGLSEITFHGLIDFVFNRAIAWPYIKIHVVRMFTHFDQYLFNKKKLIAKERMDLLKYLVNEALDGRSMHEPLDLMTGLYSIKWFSHPQGKEARRRLEFYLESLTETGELRRNNHNYVVTGHALRAIDEYEEQERKHTENVKMQWRTFWLAVAVAALTAVQAGLIKLPMLLDLTFGAGAK